MPGSVHSHLGKYKRRHKIGHEMTAMAMVIPTHPYLRLPGHNRLAQ